MRLLGQLIGTLLLVGFVLKFWWLILLVVTAVALWSFWAGRIAAVPASVAAEQARLDGLRQRADEQHNQVMSGDLLHGFYGQYPPAC